MPAGPVIADLFAKDVHRRIEEVIKVDQVDEAIVLDEIAEYVFTPSIRSAYGRILERYYSTRNNPHEGIGVWVSGFFGSGKSSFAKNLGFAVANRTLQGKSAAKQFGQLANDNRMAVLLEQIAELIPTHAVIFDIATDRGIRTGSQTVTEIMYRLFLRSLGYAEDLDLAELEITLEQHGRLAVFEQTYLELYGRSWQEQKGLVAIALSNASRVMHTLDVATFPAADSWVRAAQNRADITPGLLADRCRELIQRRRPGHALLFVIDEVGQFVARDVQKMLDLQAVVQALGRVGRGKMWLVVTSQEKLNEVVGGMDDRRIELPRLQDRFPSELQVHLEPSDIAQVTGERVLAKNSQAQTDLRALYEANRGALEAHTRLTADIKLPSLGGDRFVDLYPLLPYQIDLIIQIVSGLRTQGSASKHVGGAARTTIKLAQQVIINPSVALGDQPVGKLVTLDKVYDLVEGNIGSDIRNKIARIPDGTDHLLCQPVAKVICLLQFVQAVHRTPENIAAALYPAIGAESRLSEVRVALAELEQRRLIRSGDDGYRIPTPAEDDWEKLRDSLIPSTPETNTIYSEQMRSVWSPQPSHNLLGSRLFRAGLFLQGKSLVEGDVPVYLYLVPPGEQGTKQGEELRGRSQVETNAVFWIADLSIEIDRYQLEVFRSEEILRRRGRTAKTKDEARLIAEEGKRLEVNQGELKRLLKLALLRGSVYFRGNDRSPDEHATDLTATVANLLSSILPSVYSRFEDAAARVQGKDLDVVLTSDNLNGLTPLFAKLNLLSDEGGRPVFVTERGPLAEIMARIVNRHQYGESASGRYLVDEFGKEPFGWEFDMVRLLAACLLRSGKIEMTSKGQTIDSATSLDARATFGNNNYFRQATFRPKLTLDITQIIAAAQAYEETFGHAVAELEQSIVAETIRKQVSDKEPEVQTAANELMANALPGSEMLATALTTMRTIRQGVEKTVILEFVGAARQIKDAIARVAELRQYLNEPVLRDLRIARDALQSMWPFLRAEPDVDSTITLAAAELSDMLKRETFFRDLPAIREHTYSLQDAYKQREQAALNQCTLIYTAALQELQKEPGWDELDEILRKQIAEPLVKYTVETGPGEPSIPQLRADRDACAARLSTAIEQVYKAIDGTRLVTISPDSFFKGGIESEEELDAALTGLRSAVLRQLAEGKKVLVQ